MDKCLSSSLNRVLLPKIHICNVVFVFICYLQVRSYNCGAIDVKMNKPVSDEKIF